MLLERKQNQKIYICEYISETLFKNRFKIYKKSLTTLPTKKKRKIEP